MSLKPYPEYKDSGVEWLGDVPKGWQVDPLWTLFRRSKRFSAETEELLSVYRDHGVVPKSSRNDNFNKASEDLSKYQLVEPGDLVVNKMKAWQGSVAVSNLRGIVSPAYFVFRPQRLMNLRFIHYLMRTNSYFQFYASVSKGVRPNQWDLDPDQHRMLPVLLPDISEQQSIAHYLDRETTEIDAFSADQEELIALLNERRAATITQAVTKGLDPTVPMKDGGVEWLGASPTTWTRSKLSRLGILLESGTSVNGYSEPASAGDIGVLKTGSVSKGFFDPAENKRVAIEDLHRVTCPVCEGAVLVNRANTPELVGRAAYVQRNYEALYLSDKLWQLHFSKAQNRFMYWWLSSAPYRAQLQFHRVGASASMQNLSFSDFQSLDIALPPVDEQREISDYLDRETEEIDALVEDARQSIMLSKERRAALISAAVTGKVDVRGYLQ